MTTLASSARRRKKENQKRKRKGPGRESSEDETQRLSETLIERATLYRVSPGRLSVGPGVVRIGELSRRRICVGEE
jgi:hypothetical protein